MMLTQRPPAALAGSSRAARLPAAAPAASLLLRHRSGPRRAPAPAPSATGGDDNSSSKPTGEPLPPWVRAERERDAAAASGADKALPWPLYLVFSFLVATAAVGSIFEYFNKNALFGVLPPSSPLWAPVLGLFAITGLPTAAALFFKGVAAANASFEAQDKADGYIE